MFAYPDAQRYRLGANYTQLPPNRTVATVYAPYERDGMATITSNYDGAPNYVGSIFTPTVRSTSTQEVRHDEWLRGGAVLGLNDAPVTAEDYAQPRELWRRVFDDAERRKWVAIVAESLGGVPEELQKRAIEMFNNVDPDIGRMIAVELKETARL
jgi:catalase